tara:strand:- start:201 stop:545 length:345 start_codon:yes stop_codon:yes gene_type:complete
MNNQIYFAIGTFLFAINMIFFLRPLFLAFFIKKNLLQILLQIFKIIIGFIKSIFTIIFSRRVYYNPNSETSLKFEYFYQKQLIWSGGGSKKRGVAVVLTLNALMIISFLLGVFS